MKKPSKRVAINKRAFKKNTIEQYAALGKFVEAFESMVHETRKISIKLLRRDDEHQKLVEIPFHHGAMTAQPLFHIMRALIADHLKQPYLRVKEAERNKYFGVLNEIGSSYATLIKARNRLLHGTWYVGSITLEDNSSKTFRLEKYSPNKTGMSKDELPKDATELLALRDHCQKVWWWLRFLNTCLPPVVAHLRIEKTFQFKDGAWRLMKGNADIETLP